MPRLAISLSPDFLALIVAWKQSEHESDHAMVVVPALVRWRVLVDRRARHLNEGVVGGVVACDRWVLGGHGVRILRGALDWLRRL
jgi:hypothetical protein